MAACDRLAEMDAVFRLKQRDASLFSSDPKQHAAISGRLGWTDLAEKASAELPSLKTLADDLVSEGAADLLLLGMGGSSLAPLVMERVIGTAEGFPRLHVVDTTSPVQVSRLLAVLDPATTYVIVASKSGTTIEPLSLYAIVREWFAKAGMGNTDIGRRFLVITDPGSPLEKIRERDGLRTTLSGVPSVGGRYSALTLFGLAPAALTGIPLASLIQRAQVMERRCSAPVLENPAALLAAWMVDAKEAGCDKLTFVASDRFASFGLWIEQLVAESLGKDGTGIVPVLEDTPAPDGAYGDDRSFLVTRFADDADLAAWAREMSERRPVFEIVIADVLDIGAEFVRWEHGVALAGALLGVNPFDEPSVAEAKAATTAILEGAADEVPAPSIVLQGTSVTFAGTLEPVQPSSRADALRAALGVLRPGDYLSLLAYAADDERLTPLRHACASASHATRHAACFEVGPRYLHSTGQLHKGGPNTGVFLMITGRDDVDIPIPDKPYSLGQLHRAQAEGDLLALARHGRRVLRLDLPSTGASEMEALSQDILRAARS